MVKLTEGITNREKIKSKFKSFEEGLITRKEFIINIEQKFNELLKSLSDNSQDNTGIAFEVYKELNYNSPDNEIKLSIEKLEDNKQLEGSSLITLYQLIDDMLKSNLNQDMTKLRSFFYQGTKWCREILKHKEDKEEISKIATTVNKISTDFKKTQEMIKEISLKQKEDKVADKFILPRATIVGLVMIIFFAMDFCIFGYIIEMLLSLKKFPEMNEIKYTVYFLLVQLAIFSSGFGLANIPAMIERISAVLGANAKKKQEKLDSAQDTNIVLK